MPPPAEVLEVALLLLTVLPVTVSVPWFHRPPPPPLAVLPLMFEDATLVVPWTKTAPPPLPPLAVLFVKLLPVMVVTVFDVCTRTAPPSAVEVLPVKELSVMDRTEELRL